MTATTAIDINIISKAWKNIFQDKDVQKLFYNMQ
jgi:hypothetical protein